MELISIYSPTAEVNTYLIWSDGQAALIDPGEGREETIRELRRLLDRDGLFLRYILLTHGHYDHVGGVAPLRQARGGGVSIYIHRADWPGPDPRLFPLQGALAEIGRDREVQFYDEGDLLPLGSETIQVLHTPGHTPGSVCLKCGARLFTGDTLFAGTMGRTDLPGGSSSAMAASLKRLGELEGPLWIYPGHMEETTLDNEKTTNPCLKLAMQGKGFPF